MAKKETKLVPGEPIKRKETLTIEYQFTRDELDEKAKQLAMACQDKQAVEDKKKMVNSQLKSELDGITTKVNLLSNHLSHGFEMRDADCDIILDFVKGVREVYYQGKFIREMQLTAGDHQLELQLVEEQEKKADLIAEKKENLKLVVGEFYLLSNGTFVCLTDENPEGITLENIERRATRKEYQLYLKSK